MIKRKASQYELLLIVNDKGSGGAGIFSTKKCEDKFTVNSVSDRMIFMKVLVQGIIISIILN